MKHYYLNDLSNSSLWNIGGFDYLLAVIKNIFLFIKQIFLHIFFPALRWLKEHNKNKAIHLFCVYVFCFTYSPCHTIFLLTNVAINTNIFVLLLFFLTFGYLIFCTYLDLLFLWQNKTYLHICWYILNLTSFLCNSFQKLRLKSYLSYSKTWSLLHFLNSFFIIQSLDYIICSSLQRSDRWEYFVCYVFHQKISSFS